jgi:VanZ family protein
MSGTWRWAAWWVLVGLWALALLTPQPVEIEKKLVPSEAIFSASKGLHVAAYAFLTALGAWLPPWRGRRWLPIAIMSLHAFATEFFQQFVPSRHGCIEDVGIDHIGIVLGVLLTLNRWRRPS